MSDSSLIDAALVAKLSADAPLMAIASDGVFFDEAPQGKTRFIIVSLIEENDEAVFGGRAIEDALYLVKLVALDGSGADMKAGALRIDVVLDEQALTVSGYTHMAMFRESRLRLVEVDDADPSIRWHHRGGNYRIQMSLVGA